MKSQTRQLERQVLTAAEVGKVLGIGITKVREMIRDGELPVLPLGKNLRIPLAAIDALIAGAAPRTPPQKAITDNGTMDKEQSNDE